MSDYPDLEISLHREAADYRVEFRLSEPNGAADARFGQDSLIPAQFDRTGLRGLEHDPTAYGELLTNGLFADPAALAAFTQAEVSYA